jgi:hypothetical protein
MLTCEHPSTSKPARVFEDDRRCSRPGCITILCSYDPGPECFVHADQTLVAQQRRVVVERDEMFALMEQTYGMAG